jgi:hypothetical protein
MERGGASSAAYAKFTSISLRADPNNMSMPITIEFIVSSRSEEKIYNYCTKSKEDGTNSYQKWSKPALGISNKNVNGKQGATIS